MFGAEVTGINLEPIDKANVIAGTAKHRGRQGSANPPADDQGIENLGFLIRSVCDFTHLHVPKLQGRLRPAKIRRKLALSDQYKMRVVTNPLPFQKLTG